MTTAPEIYASNCCGAVFTPGFGPDNIHDAEQGARLMLEMEKREEPVHAAGAKIATESERWERVHRVSQSEARLFDAMRAGKCPCCGESVPGLKLIADGSGIGGPQHD